VTRVKPADSLYTLLVEPVADVALTLWGFPLVDAGLRSCSCARMLLLGCPVSPASSVGFPFAFLRSHGSCVPFLDAPAPVPMLPHLGPALAMCCSACSRLWLWRQDCVCARLPALFHAKILANLGSALTEPPSFCSLAHYLWSGSLLTDWVSVGLSTSLVRYEESAMETLHCFSWLASSGHLLLACLCLEISFAG